MFTPAVQSSAAQSSAAQSSAAQSSAAQSSAAQSSAAQYSPARPRASRRTAVRRIAQLLATGALLSAGAGCALLGASHWNCSDEATAKYTQLEGLVKQWSQADVVNMQLIGDDCGKKDGYRFIEVVTPSAALEEHLKTICKQDQQQQIQCSSNGMNFTLVIVEQDDSPRVFGLVLRQS